MNTNPNMHTEDIDDEGQVIQYSEDGGLCVATFYSPCVSIGNRDGYLAVVCDAPGHYVETRVDHALLIQAGWTPPPAASPENDV